MWDYAESGLEFRHLALRLAVAMVLGILIGVERERRDHPAGMRTHAVVSIASAIFVLVSIFGMPLEEGQPGDPGRIAAQVVSGIGFLGAGVIFMRQNAVRGLTTAASIWAVAGIGMASGAGLLMTAIVGTAFLLFVQGVLHPLKKHMFTGQGIGHRLTLTIDGTKHREVIEAIQQVNERDHGYQLIAIDLDAPDTGGRRRLRLRMESHDNAEVLDVIDSLESIPGVDHIAWKFNIES